MKMETIEMTKKIISFSPPDISDLEIAEVAETLRSGWITTGPRTKLLERRLAAFIETGRTDVDCLAGDSALYYTDRVVCLSSATAAEELNLRLLGIGPGDEVIVPAYTYTATASAAIHCGATVKFIDIQKDGDSVSHMPEMDYEKLEEAITERTKAIVAVDIGGIVCDYDQIYNIVRRKRYLFKPIKSDGSELGDLSSRIQKELGRIAVIADSAHSLGASRVFMGARKNCGQIADFTSFSFHAVKNITTAEGGATTWIPFDSIGNNEIYQMFQLLSLHGQSRDAMAKSKPGLWEYDVIGPWYKCNMTDIMAGIGLAQLKRYPELLARRRHERRRRRYRFGNHPRFHAPYASRSPSGRLFCARSAGRRARTRQRSVALDEKTFLRAERRTSAPQHDRVDSLSRRRRTALVALRLPARKRACAQSRLRAGENLGSASVHRAPLL